MTPFDVLTLRFERSRNDERVVAELHPESHPVHPGADWDRARDARSTVEAPTAFVAVVASRAKDLEVNVRFLRFPAVQNWLVWAEDRAANSVVPRVDGHCLFEPHPGCVTKEIKFRVEARLEGVGRHFVEWEWCAQYLNPRTLEPEGPVESLGFTRFVLFSILAVPLHAPWTQIEARNPDGDLPRVEVLELACEMASGTRDLVSAAGRVASSVFELGIPNRSRRRVVYDDRDDFVCDAEHHLFRWADFLDAISGHAAASPVHVACADIASAVCVIANSLGGDLRRAMIFIRSSPLPLPFIKLIGLEPSRPKNWANHVVAWSPSTCGIFDGCLQFDAQAGPGERWVTPAGIPFGESSEKPRELGYRHLLVTRKAAECEFSPLRDLVLDRRSACDVPDSAVAKLRSEYHEFLSERPPVASLPEHLAFRALTPPHNLARFEEGFETRGRVSAAVWEGVGEGDRSRVSLIGELTPDVHSAVSLAAWRLGFYRQRMVPRLDERFPGAILCATDDGQNCVLVYANGVLRVRSEGPRPLDVVPLIAPVLSTMLAR